LVDLLLKFWREVVDVFEVDGDDGLGGMASVVDGNNFKSVV
jgi:hypothetical protein